MLNYMYMIHLHRECAQLKFSYLAKFSRYQILRKCYSVNVS